MAVLFFTLFLARVFLICGTIDKALTDVPPKRISDVRTSPPTMSVEEPLDLLETLMMSLVCDLNQDVQNTKTKIVNLVEEVELKLSNRHMLDAHCKDVPDFSMHKVYRSCRALFDAGFNTSGVYLICPDGENVTQTYCDQDLFGGGWTVFQRRIDGSVNFFQSGDNFKDTFGNAAGEFWLGLHHIHHLTANIDTKLLVELEFGREKVYAQYANFSIADETDNYQLTISGFSSSQNIPGDSLTPHNGHEFLTHYRDDDPSIEDCDHQGSWWHTGCGPSNLNGIYNRNNTDGIIWSTWKGNSISLPAVRMLLTNKE